MSTAIEWTSADSERFDTYVSKTRGCWHWTGSCTKGGYGKFWLNGRTVSAHVFAFVRANGSQPKVVRHTCDTASCCKPAHLIPGSTRDNVLDTKERGRGPSTTALHELRTPLKNTGGEKNGRAVLNRNQVEAIREEYRTNKRTSLRLLAAKYDVSKSLIQRIIQRKVWNT